MPNARTTLLIALSIVICHAVPLGVFCDADSDCFYVPPIEELPKGVRLPALVLLHCNGALPIDLDTCRYIADSLGWIMASCHATRNHRDINANAADIVKTLRKLFSSYPVDPRRIFLFGYSGQGVQALATMFLYPELVRGVVATCANAGAIHLARFDRLTHNYVYLITRESDWNLEDNRRMYQTFNLRGVRAAIKVTPGVHQPGRWQEMLIGARWLGRQTEH